MPMQKAATAAMAVAVAKKRNWYSSYINWTYNIFVYVSPLSTATKATAKYQMHQYNNNSITSNNNKKNYNHNKNRVVK